MEETGKSREETQEARGHGAPGAEHLLKDGRADRQIRSLCAKDWYPAMQRGDVASAQATACGWNVRT